MTTPTLRQELIQQLRAALGQLESPVRDDVTVCFDIGETTFEYDVSSLDEQSLLRKLDEVS